jgi:hypothetical protein
MPRKKRKEADVENTASAAAAVSEPQTSTVRAPLERPAYIDGPPTAETGAAAAEPEPAEHGKNWGPPYKAVYTSSAKGFELGENRRYKQRVFKFSERPDDQTIAVLKDNGFTYRPEEKAWTIHADNASRLLSDQLAARFAGQSQDFSR